MIICQIEKSDRLFASCVKVNFSPQLNIQLAIQKAQKD
jgi:hypothetical protein